MLKSKYDKTYNMLMNNNVLFINGLAGVGKTTFALDLIDKKYLHNIYLDCESDLLPLLKLADNLESVEDLAEFIENGFGVSKSLQGDLIIVFDNVDRSQLFKDKIFNDILELGYRIIVIFTAYTDVTETITKDREVFTLYPYNFEEYLEIEANELSIGLVQHLSLGLKKLPDMLHDGILSSFLDYYEIGGMPVPRNTFYSYINGEILTVSAIKSSYHYAVETLYRRSGIDDKLKYQCNNILTSLIEQMAGDNYQKFVLSSIREGLSNNSYEEAFKFLEKNGIIYRSYNIENPKIFSVYLYDFVTAKELIKEHMAMTGKIVDVTKLERICIINYLVYNCKRANYDVYFWRSRYLSYIEAIIQKDMKTVALKVYNSDNGKCKSLAEFEKKHEKSYLYELNTNNLKKYRNKLNLPYYAISSVIEMI